MSLIGCDIRQCAYCWISLRARTDIGQSIAVLQSELFVRRDLSNTISISNGYPMIKLELFPIYHCVIHGRCINYM